MIATGQAAHEIEQELVEVADLLGYPQIQVAVTPTVLHVPTQTMINVRIDNIGLWAAPMGQSPRASAPPSWNGCGRNRHGDLHDCLHRRW